MKKMDSPVKCVVLKNEEQAEFFERHFPHRLVLLRTFRRRLDDRSIEGESNGDLYRCAKDASMIAIRLWMDFFCLGGERNESTGEPSLYWKSSNRGTDVKIQSFDLKQVVLPDCNDRECIAKAYVIADKELAHLTKIFDVRNDDERTLVRASQIVEQMICESLYKPCGREMPEHRDCWGHAKG